MVKWFQKKLNSEKDKPVSTTAQKLTDITRGMHHAASTTSALLAEQYIQLLNQFFDSEEYGSLKAKMFRIDVDAKDDLCAFIDFFKNRLKATLMDVLRHKELNTPFQSILKI